MRSIKFILILFSLVLCDLASGQKNYSGQIITFSPDKKISISISTGDQIKLHIKYLGKDLVQNIYTGLEIMEFPEAFKNPVIKTTQTSFHSDQILPVVAEKRSIIPDIYNETIIYFRDNTGIKLRAYDDGVAWRLLTKFDKPVTVINENLCLNMNPTDTVYFGEEDNFISHSERYYTSHQVDKIPGEKMCVLPALFCTQSNVRAVFTESDLLDYPGLYLKKNSADKSQFNGILPKVCKNRAVTKDHRSYIPADRFDFIAKTSGKRDYPWRVFGISDTDAGLLENDIVYRLASPCRVEDTGWIKPGKVAWDWWNDWNLKNVSFNAGINTETYKYYIDFASKYGIEYVILDEGWSANDDLEKINPDMDMDELFSYSKIKNVGLILWVTGKALEDKFESSLNKFQAWGCAGIKMDFMIRDDQEMVNFYEKVAAETAKRKMLADFHGSYKPTGLSRTYPNQLTREGVRGLENSKWSRGITPAHDCTLPFTRMFAGPMDYTPGAMHNTDSLNFTISWSRPMSLGTRCHELAKYIIFESPLQMLCDAPTNYTCEDLTMDFLSAVPVTWDTTIAINAEIGKYLSMARLNGETWYIGAMTDWTEREFDVPLSFLPEGKFIMKTWQDGPNANRNAEDFLVTEQEVDNMTKIKIHLAKGGGFVSRITRN
ncbi:MAG: glycoside hydrolase family 97 protein [Saprospiraceae bacterium]|nr:glycoside hydrolase family 97 protein [Saprospiraceae bacterium]